MLGPDILIRLRAERLRNRGSITGCVPTERPTQRVKQPTRETVTDIYLTPR